MRLGKILGTVRGECLGCAGETLIDSWGWRPLPNFIPTSSIRDRPAPLMYCHQPLNQFGKIGQKRLQKQPITHCFSASNQFGQKTGHFPKHLQRGEISQSLINSQNCIRIFAPRELLSVSFLVFHHHYGHFPYVTAVRPGVWKGFWNHNYKLSGDRRWQFVTEDLWGSPPPLRHQGDGEIGI